MLHIFHRYIVLTFDLLTLLAMRGAIWPPLVNFAFVRKIGAARLFKFYSIKHILAKKLGRVAQRFKFYDAQRWVGDLRNLGKRKLLKIGTKTHLIVNILVCHLDINKMSTLGKFGQIS